VPSAAAAAAVPAEHYVQSGLGVAIAQPQCAGSSAAATSDVQQTPLLQGSRGGPTLPSPFGPVAAPFGAGFVGMQTAVSGKRGLSDTHPQGPMQVPSSNSFAGTDSSGATAGHSGGDVMQTLVK
jgi:hypothetical protein